MMGKPYDYWLIVAGMIVYVATKDAESEPIKNRIRKTIVSALLTLGGSGSISEYFGVDERLVAIGIMAAGLILLDVVTAVISDRKAMQALIIKKLGGDKDE